MNNHIINLEINCTDFPSSLETTLRSAAFAALSTLSKNEIIELTILVCDDNYMQNLNRTYRGVDRTTDVLSFEERYQIPDSDATYLGDIALSYPTAARQAKFSGHQITAELSLLVAHGVLHLFGYDHLNAKDKIKMWDIQKQILTSLGFGEISTHGEEPDAQE